MPIDKDLFEVFNQPGTPWLDFVMRGLSANANLLVGAALGALYLWRRSPQKLLAVVLFFAAIGLTDLVSARVVKPAVGRQRPCLAEPKEVSFPFGCNSGLSFPSSHAANSAAAAAVFTWAAPRAGAFVILISALVGISRVYLGVHYPTDVMGGWVLGAAIGLALVFLTRLQGVVKLRQ